uniref:Calcium release activated channel regulator 2A n=1 Tax=Acanthochromis polyacanthus TaxID=80966 RepID=A0A3Q1F8F7_9TELE
MAAFTTPATNDNNTVSKVAAQTAWQRQGSHDKVLNLRKSENGDVGRYTILEKTHEFFQMCDIENKGFITRRDMQRLNGELPLSAEELENVFDTLDSDGNGYLTLEEFSSGFSEFLSGQKISAEEGMGEKNPNKSLPEVLYQTQWEESLARGEEDEEEKHFCMLMESLGANSHIVISGFYPHRKAATHDDEIQRLYEEMEQQIKNEKDRIVLQDYERFLSRSQDMELQLSSKEKELEQLFQKQRRLECQCQELHSEQHVTKVENVKLKQTNDELARELEHTTQELTLAQEQLSLLQEQSTRLHEEKEMEVYRLTEGLQRERASLLKQLDLLSEDEEELTSSSVRQSPANGSCQPSLPAEAGGHLQRIISIEEDHLPHLLNDCQAQTPLQECKEGAEVSDGEENIDLKTEIPTSPRGQPVGKETSINEEGGPSAPDRLFKIVLVGNSSVGKTSLLRRFCDDSFHSGTSATVGIKYVKPATAVVDQAWYRSITKQFFRKADGVVVMYDITAEQSFTAVRQWLTSVKEGAGEDIPLMLLGNKTDKEIERQVQKAVGERLAKNSFISLCLIIFLRILKEQEDREKEKTVELVSNPSEKKRSCC